MIIKRDFNEWLNTMTDSVAEWSYYTDFSKVFRNVDSIKIPLNLMNSLLGSKSIKSDFLVLIKKYPEVIKCIPILIAKRMKSKKDVVIIKDPKKNYYFDFRKKEYADEEYALLMEKTGLFNLIENKIVGSLYDYVTGVEVGLDSNARKNRTGTTMENLVQKYLEEHGFDMGRTLFKEIYQYDVEKRYGIDLSTISNKGGTNKRFDFVVKSKNKTYIIETNFYSSGGSKLNETARSYKLLAEEINKLADIEFVWITDGQGWNSARNNLEETFDVMEHLYNVADLDKGVLSKLV